MSRRPDARGGTPRAGPARLTATGLLVGAWLGSMLLTAAPAAAETVTLWVRGEHFSTHPCLRELKGSGLLNKEVRQLLDAGDWENPEKREAWARSADPRGNLVIELLQNLEADAPSRFAVLTAPYAFRNVDHFAAFTSSDMYFDLVDNVARSDNKRVLGLSIYGHYFLASAKRIGSMTDLSQLRIAGRKANAFQAVGAKRAKTGYGEIGRAANSGQFDAVVLMLDHLFDFDGANLLTRFPFVQQAPVETVVLVFYIEEDKFQALPAEYRNRLRDIVAYTANKCSGVSFGWQSKSFQSIPAKGGTVVEPPAGQVERIKRLRHEDWGSEEDLRRLGAIR